MIGPKYLEPVIKELQNQGFITPDQIKEVLFEDNWNEEAHVGLTLTIKECREIVHHYRGKKTPLWNKYQSIINEQESNKTNRQVVKREKKVGSKTS